MLIFPLHNIAFYWDVIICLTLYQHSSVSISSEMILKKHVHYTFRQTLENAWQFIPN